MSPEMTPADMVAEFHSTFLVPRMDGTSSNLRQILRTRSNLLSEEFAEVEEAMLALRVRFSSSAWPAEDWAHLAKELSDLVYVVYGTADLLGIPLDAAVASTHKSNMSKLGEDGKPIFREDGKVLKGPNYREPDLSEVVRITRLNQDIALVS